MAGQISGLIKKEETSKEIIEDLMNGAKEAIEKVGRIYE